MNSGYSPANLEWSSEKVKDLIFGCVLNIKLKNAGLCKKYICEMSESDLPEYVELYHTILGTISE